MNGLRVLSVAVVGCGAAAGIGCGGAGGTPLPSVAPAADTARASVQPAAGRPSDRTWVDPVVRRDGAGGFVAALRPSSRAGGSRPARLRLRGIGFAGRGTGAGSRWVGPGVTLPWTSIEQGRYVASVGLAGRRISLRVWSRGGDWQVLVDGRARGGPGPVGSDYAQHSLTLTFPRAARRTIDFELANGAWITGLQVGGRDRTYLPPAPERRPRLYWLGDSFSTGSGAGHPGFTDLVHQVGTRLDVPDLTIDALGGTGYVKANESAGFPDYLTRARASLGRGRARPDVVVVAGSINDAGVGQRQMRDAAAALYASIGRALPAAKVIVIAFTSQYPVPAGLARSSGAMLQAARAAPNVAGVLDLPGETQDAARRMGIAIESLQRPDGHPTPAGHDLYAQLISSFIERKVASLRSARRDEP